MKILKIKTLCYLLILFFSASALANEDWTTVQNGVSLHSNYYPNPTSKFKGTIIFFNGSGIGSEEWEFNTQFFKCIQKQGSLFFYDRSGLGVGDGSSPNLNLSSKNPITGKLINDQLLVLLKKQHIPPPYLIVAHSYGAMFAGYFALENPTLVKGLLLIDPVPRDYEYADNILALYQKSLIDAKKYSASMMYDRYNSSQIEIIYSLIGFSNSKEQIKKLGVINNDIPVVIISSTTMEYHGDLIKEDWYASQQQWLNKNPHSKIFQVESGHLIQIDKPEVVCEQLEDLVDAAN